MKRPATTEELVNIVVTEITARLGVDTPIVFDVQDTVDAVSPHLVDIFSEMGCPPTTARYITGKLEIGLQFLYDDKLGTGNWLTDVTKVLATELGYMSVGGKG